MSTESFGPLKGVKVIEMGQLLAGPFVGSRLADFGAEVIKIETPGTGDPMREWGHHRYKGKSLWWPTLARNKKSVTINLREKEGQEIVRKLLSSADGLIENFKPGTLEKWGMSPKELHKINPKLIIVRVSGFGQTGPSAGRPGFASIGEAMGGIRFINGFPDTPPPRFGISLGDTLTAMFAVEGFLMALFERQENDGKGQVVDAAITESCFSMLESTLTEYDKCGIIRQPSGTGLANVAPSNIYPTSDDNFVVVAANLDAMFRRLCEAMNKTEWASDPRFVDHKARGNNASELDGLIADWTKTLPIREIGQKLDEHGVVWGPINSIKDIAEDAQFKSRDMILEIEDETFGSLKVPGIVPKLSKTPGQVSWLGPQIAGAHNKEVLSDLGFTEEEQKELLDKKII
jgi:formyl-CoA transferase/succinyl-CoA--D-citramalate CoA-transferase